MSSSNLTIFSFGELVAHARAQAPFYRRLYVGLPDQPTLQELPVVNQEEFWQAHHRDKVEVLTAPLTNGIVLNSGGTTGAPKYSYFNDQEWDSIIALSARTYEAAGLQDGDRVANLFAGGNLYASFIFATESMKWTRPRLLQLPLGFSPDIAAAATIIHEFKANVLAGFPTHLLRIIDHLDQAQLTGVHIDRIIYGGELVTKDREAFLQARFPGIQIRSAGYASVDAGLIGYADAGCQTGEHRVFDEAMIMEIVDEETWRCIEAPGQPGRIVFTSLIRRLMPLLRYPTGDRAQWVEPIGATDRKFRLLGRSEESARVAHYSLGVSEAANLLEPFRQKYGIEQFQLLVTRENLRDCLVFRLATNQAVDGLRGAGEEILTAFELVRPDIYKPAHAGAMHLPRVEWIQPDRMLTHPRTGKTLRVVDQRND